VTIENDAAVEFIAIGIVAVDFHDFGDEAPTGAPFEVHDHVDGITDVGLNGAIGQIHAALQNAACEAGQGLPCGGCVHGGKASRVSGVEKLQQIEGFSSANFADTRTGYACGWIEIKNGVLELIPHPDSGVPTRTFRYPGEVDVVGRVTGVAMRITGEEFAPIGARARRSPSKK
jgi:hypothetical protein